MKLCCLGIILEHHLSGVLIYQLLFVAMSLFR